MEKQPIACGLFDFDDTLCRGDSILPYLLYAVRKGYAPKIQLFRAALAFVRQKIDPSQTVRSKEVSLSFIRGRSQREMDALARDFFRDVLCPNFFPEGKKTLAQLKAEGKRLIVISASADVYMRVLPEFMPVDAVLSTRCEVDAHGCYTGKIESNCKGEEKPRRLAAYLETQHLTLDKEASCAYGDSPSDAPMLLLTAHPCIVDAGSKLRALVPTATQVKWH